jgi:hypothetical protein
MALVRAAFIQHHPKTLAGGLLAKISLRIAAFSKCMMRKF